MRESALVVLGLTAVVGLAMAVAGAGDAFGAHGVIIMIFAAVLFFPVLRALDAPEPPI